MQKLYNHLEELPYKAEWHQRTIRLVEDPTEEHLIEFRNPIKAIQSLWGDPLFAKELVYSPERMWANAERQSHLYNEMWTGQWWWNIQVNHILQIII